MVRITAKVKVRIRVGFMVRLALEKSSLGDELIVNPLSMTTATMELITEVTQFYHLFLIC